MKFSEFDERMRVFETLHDHCVGPEIYMVARLDGRGFTRLTKEVGNFDVPFDERFRDCMVATTKHLMDCGFQAIYGYTQSDEISLLLHRDETAFGRKLRKLNSVLAGEASAAFSMSLNRVAVFDCRICEFPSALTTRDYFRWRGFDAARNALSSHCYWALRKEGQTAAEATSFLERTRTSERHELLFARGINFNELPAWQKNGVGVYWEVDVKDGVDPRSGATAATVRRRLAVNFELPIRAAYDGFVAELIDAATAERR